MSMLRGKIDPKKEEQDRLQGILLEMLKEEENKYCADCQAKTPRWAAWNLGVFICIRCAGIHRNLGVHISKVRSVNLDSWTPEQVQTMRVMGNEKARRIYEHDLPEHFRRPTSDSQIESFIRAKYEAKRYMLRDFVYPRVDVADLPKSIAAAAAGTKKAPIISGVRMAAPSSSNGGSANVSSVNDLLDLSIGTTSTPATVNSSGGATTGNLLDDFAGLTIQQPSPNVAPPAPVNTSASNDFDDFGSFVSASSAPAPAQPATASFADFSSVAATSGLSPGGISENGGDGKKTNADIMSLFGNSTGASAANNGAAPMLVAPGGFTAFGLQAAPQAPIQQTSFANFGSIPSAVPQQQPSQVDAFGGLAGLNFGAPAPAPVPQHNMGYGAGIGSLGGLSMNSFGAQPPIQHQQPSQFAGLSGFGASPATSHPQSHGRPAVTSPTSPSFSIPNKTNAFADLALGKVMKTSYGQSALHSSGPATQSRPATTAPINNSSFANFSTPSAPIPSNNDLFDMFASAPPPVATTTAPSNLDDLLGL